MKKISLGLTEEEPYDIFGILSPAKSYVLAHDINHLHGYDLARHEEDLSFPYKEIDSYHPIFSYTIPDNWNQVYLIGNKGFGALLHERKEYDYLLVFKGEAKLAKPQLYIESLRKLPSVQFVEYFESTQFKSLKNHPIAYLP